MNFQEKIKTFKQMNLNKYLFYFLLNMENKASQFKMDINTSCLVFSHYPGAEVKGLGGLIAQYPKNFEILCMTNGSNILEGFDSVQSASIKKQEFQEVMKSRRVKGSKIFDIDSNTLKNQYSTFKKIDVSEADYIFVPNVYDTNPDAIALLQHFKRMLQEKEYKKNLQIVMYESDIPVCVPNLYVNISSIAETKKKILNTYYPQDKFPNLTEKIIGINLFRAVQCKCDYAEAFMSFSIDEFLKIPMI